MEKRSSGEKMEKRSKMSFSNINRLIKPKLPYSGVKNGHFYLILGLFALKIGGVRGVLGFGENMTFLC